MGRIFTVAAQYLAAPLILAIWVSVPGCSDSGSVSPVVELASLSVTPGTLQPSFSGATTQYTVNLANNVTSVTVTAQPAVAGDSVSIEGQSRTSHTVDLGDPGSTTPVSIIVSESGTNSRTYTVLLKRADLAGNNSLQNLTVSPGTPPLDFNENNLSYAVSVPNNVNSVTVTPTLQDPAATMTVNGQPATSGQARTISLNPAGQSTNITILVKAQDQTEKPYTITVSRGVSNNNNLQSLDLSAGSLNFRPSDTSYIVNVGSNVTSVVVTPRLQDSTAIMTVNGQATNSGQARTIQLGGPGSNTPIFIIVTAQNGTQKIYTVGVTRAALNGNNNLESLTVSSGSLNPKFSANRTSYTVSVGGRVGSITVTAAPDDSGARMTINGLSTNAGQARSISLGPDGSSTEIQIIVTAQNGSQKPYIITVNRAALSSDNNLEALTVRPGDLEPAFASETENYAVEVPTTVTSVTVTATKSDPNAVISGSLPNQGQAVIPLDGPGTSKTVSITVTAPNGNRKTYTVIVTRLAPSTDSNLSSLTVSSGSLNPSFAAGTLNYTVDVASSVDTITVSAIKSDPNAVMSASGGVIAPPGDPTGSVSVPLGLGTSTSITITVTAENRVTTKTYRITVNRPAR
jgi:hypothetical protein